MGRIRHQIAGVIMLVVSIMTSSCALFSDRQENTAAYYFKRQYYREAFARIWMPANLGDPSAQYALGYMYYYGLGTIIDHDMARVWFSHAAAKGYSPAKEAMKMLTNPEYVQYDVLTKENTLHAKRYTYKEFTPLENHNWVQVQPAGSYTVCVLRADNMERIDNCLARGYLPDRIVKYRYMHNGKIYMAAVAGQFQTQHEAEMAAARINRALHITTAQPIAWRNVHQVMLPL